MPACQRAVKRAIVDALRRDHDTEHVHIRRRVADHLAAGQRREGHRELAVDIGDAYRYFRKLKNWQTLECEADISDVSLHRDNVIAVWGRLMPDVHP